LNWFDGAKVDVTGEDAEIIRQIVGFYNNLLFEGV